MSARSAILRLHREVRTPAPGDPVDADGDQLAREVTRAFAVELARYRRLRETEPGWPNPADRPEGWELDSVRSTPPDKVSFGAIERLTRADPDEAAAVWETVKAAARDDLDRGWLAGRAIEYLGGSAWERACFLAVRDRLRRASQPRNGAEVMLLEEMAQYEVVRQWWIGVLAMRSRDPLTVANRQGQGDRGDERYQSAAEATFEAGRMVERLQRLYQNAVRLLVGLRRGKSPVVFQRSGQVNVTAGPQLNLAVAADVTRPEASTCRSSESSPEV
jgi:hypothetical protein